MSHLDRLAEKAIAEGRVSPEEEALIRQMQLADAQLEEWIAADRATRERTVRENQERRAKETGAASGAEERRRELRAALRTTR